MTRPRPRDGAPRAPKVEQASECLDTIRLPGRAKVVALRVIDGRLWVFSKSRIYELVARRHPRRGGTPVSGPRIVLRRGLFYREDALGHALSRQVVADELNASRQREATLEGLLREVQGCVGVVNTFPHGLWGRIDAALAKKGE